jgi:hypothetical protein
MPVSFLRKSFVAHRNLSLRFYRLAIVVLAAVASSLAAESETKIISWNAYSVQFIDPPVFQLLPLPETKAYQAVVGQGPKTWQVESKEPRLDLASIWSQMGPKKFKLTLKWLDGKRQVLVKEESRRIKAPDWQGFREAPADWTASADRNIAYLVRIAESGRAPYREPGVPVWIWSAASPCPVPTPKSLGPGYGLKDFREYFEYRAKLWPDGHGESYPGCIVPAIIYAMLAHAQAGRPQAETAMRLARVTADWALKNRLPAGGALPLFPYSTISRGKFFGGIESTSVNLLRASWIGLSLVRLYEATKDARYLEYARHIARVTARFQAPDGSFPYRVNPQNGNVTEAFCTGGIQFSLLVEALSAYGIEPELVLASERAIQWMTAYPATTNHWQGGYEDIGEYKPYKNLTHWEAQLLLQYLCRHRDRDPSYLPLAKKLLRFVEDQFVLFGPDSEAHPVPVKGPLVFEQYLCWWPMEVHTGYYIQSLLELHKATGEQVYLDKAMAAGNAICAQQFDDGAISNWGTRWLENGQSVGEDCGHIWYNTNAIASASLYMLDSYVHKDRKTPRR